MIFNVAGTSGAGKSHLVRGFIDWSAHHGTVKPRYKEGRKEPIGYDVSIKKFDPVIHIVGAYQSADTAGCDTIRDVVWAYDYILQQRQQGKFVLYEGLFMMNMTRGPRLAAETNEVVVIQLTDSLATCIGSINQRRAARGDGKLANKQNTIANFTRANNYCDKMRAAGAVVIKVRRAEALNRLLVEIGLVNGSCS